MDERVEREIRSLEESVSSVVDQSRTLASWVDGCSFMKTTRILIALLIICLLFTSFGGQVVQAAVHPSLYFTQEELVNLRALQSSPSHSAMWDSISSWADAHVNDPPPDEPDAGDLKDLSVVICAYIDNMVFMYRMTDNTTYAEAAKTWMLHIADNWTAWNAGDPGEPNTMR